MADGYWRCFNYHPGTTTEERLDMGRQFTFETTSFHETDEYGRNDIPIANGIEEITVSITFHYTGGSGTGEWVVNMFNVYQGPVLTSPVTKPFSEDGILKDPLGDTITFKLPRDKWLLYLEQPVDISMSYNPKGGNNTGKIPYFRSMVIEVVYNFSAKEDNLHYSPTGVLINGAIASVDQFNPTAVGNIVNITCNRTENYPSFKYRAVTETYYFPDPTALTEYSKSTKMTVDISNYHYIGKELAVQSPDAYIQYPEPIYHYDDEDDPEPEIITEFFATRIISTSSYVVNVGLNTPTIRSITQSNDNKLTISWDKSIPYIIGGEDDDYTVLTVKYTIYAYNDGEGNTPIATIDGGVSTGAISEMLSKTIDISTFNIPYASYRTGFIVEAKCLGVPFSTAFYPFYVNTPALNIASINIDRNIISWSTATQNPYTSGPITYHLKIGNSAPIDLVTTVYTVANPYQYDDGTTVEVYATDTYGRSNTVSSLFRYASLVRYYTGSRWQDCIMLVYTGSGWKECTIKEYDGTSWSN